MGRLYQNRNRKNVIGFERSSWKKTSVLIRIKSRRQIMGYCL